jgi:hypothetical protein
VALDELQNRSIHDTLRNYWIIILANHYRINVISANFPCVSNVNIVHTYAQVQLHFRRLHFGEIWRCEGGGEVQRTDCRMSIEEAIQVVGHSCVHLVYAVDECDEAGLCRESFRIRADNNSISMRVCFVDPSYNGQTNLLA